MGKTIPEKSKAELEKDISSIAEKYYSKGYEDGTNDTLDELAPAISDGTRKGSSKCASVLKKSYGGRK